MLPTASSWNQDETKIADGEKQIADGEKQAPPAG